MVTGIITDVGQIESVEQRGDLHARIRTGQPLDHVAIGASIACSGVCLTVVDKGPDWFTVDISAETVSRTAPDMWAPGHALNLERSLKLGDELGGHLVTGHVDGIGRIVSVAQEGDSIRILIAVEPALAASLATKGSVTVDGVSLTVNSVEDQAGGTAVFGLNIIPHTAQVTTLGTLVEGRAVNIEIDVIARYLQRMVDMRRGM